MALRTIDEFGRKLRAREISSVELVKDCLRRVEAEDERLNAFILVLADEARNAARRADAELASGTDRGALHGIPVSVKDLFDMTGTVTTAASRVREGIVATEDAAAIAQLRLAGAVIIGKTNLHEFAFGTTNEDSAFGPSRHPLDASRSPGGSSGGSAASVAAGMALASMGTDTGGSIRIPSAACGLVGLKPTYGELSAAGVVPLSRTLDHIGPLTSCVADAWHMLHALRDQRTGPIPPPLRLDAIRLGVPRRYFCEVLEDGVRRAFEDALADIGARGVSFVDVDIAHADLIASIYVHIVFGDAAAYHGDALDRVPEKYTPNVRLRLEMARYVTAEDYVRALDGRLALRRVVDRALAGVDALVLPTLPVVAPSIGATTVEINGHAEPIRNLMLRLTQLFNLTGHPAISLPCGTSAGLPCGLQLAGRHGQTDRLLLLAMAVEEVLGRS